MKKIKCSCASEYQDKRYGKGIRIANDTTHTVGNDTLYRCTVCNKESTTKGVQA